MREINALLECIEKNDADKIIPYINMIAQTASKDSINSNDNDKKCPLLLFAVKQRNLFCLQEMLTLNKKRKTMARMSHLV